MQTTRIPTHPRLVTRALLLPLGEEACRMAEALLALSQAWLGGEAPLVVAASQTESGGMAAWLDRLASQPLMQSLARRGIALARPNEAEIWALIDLTGGQEPGLAVEEAARILNDVTEEAWQRLRIHLAGHALLLASPAEQILLEAWVDGLAPLCEGRIYLAGPVNQAHLCLTEERWREQAITAVAALLWSKAPSHSHLGHTAAVKRTVVALGGAAWSVPRADLNRWLALTFARRCVARLRQEEICLPKSQASDPGGAEQWMQELSEALAAPPSGLVWGERRPGLSALAELPSALAQEADRAQKQREAEVQRGRRRWLAAQLESWTQRQGAMRQTHLAPSEGWPRLPAYCAGVQTQREETMHQLQVVQSHLEGWGERLAQAEEASRQAQAELAELCRLFPTPDLRGGLTILTHPWRVVSWLWAYTVWLPRRAQKLLDGLARQTTARWHEGNWHTIRQYFLVQAQECQLALDEAGRVAERLAELDGTLTATLKEMEMERLLPWSPTGLEELWTRLFADGSACALAFLTEHPLPGWKESGADDLRNALLAWVAPWLAPLARWDGVDHLVEALPGVALGEWLAEEVETAQPLWPDQEMRSGSQGEGRLLLGHSPVYEEEADAGHGERLERLREAAGVIPDRVESLFYGDGVALLRLALVDLEMDEQHL